MRQQLLASALLLSACSAQADAFLPVYAEIGLHFLNYEERDDTDVFKATPKVIRLIGGAELGPNLGAEVMLGLGFDSDLITVNGYSYSDFNLKLNSMYGFFVKPRIELAPNVNVFARVGYAHASVTATIDNFGSATTDEGGLAYGLGLNLRINPRVSLNMDYMSYLRKSTFTAQGVTFGLGYHF